MAQHDYVAANGSGAVVRGDFNDALLAVATMNSGASAPSTTYAYMAYVNTSDGHLYQRNAANTGWIDHGDVSSALLRYADVGSGPNNIPQLDSNGKVVSAVLALEINPQTGTTYTTVGGENTDAGKLVTLTNSSAISLTIPPNSSVPYPIGTAIAFQQGGAGTVTMAPGSGVTLQSRNGLVSGGQYAMWSIVKKATDTWAVTGDLTS
jgi:hypothetical protein